MKDQRDGQSTSPDSWKGVENDAWWQEQRRRREEERAKLRG